MSPSDRRWVDLAALVVGGTGLAYGFMRYLLEPVDEWAIVNHPWQPHVHHLHVLTAPLLVFAVALVWRRHVRARLAESGGPRRVTGLGLAAQFGPMVASGYLIQVSSSPAWRSTWIWIHALTGSLWLVLAVGHRLLRAPSRQVGGVSARWILPAPDPDWSGRGAAAGVPTPALEAAREGQERRQGRGHGLDLADVAAAARAGHVAAEAGDIRSAEIGQGARGPVHLVAAGESAGDRGVRGLHGGGRALTRSRRSGRCGS